MLELGQPTSHSVFVVPEVWLDHVDPPLVVARITPLSPTAMHALVVAHDTPIICVVVPEVWEDQVDPLLVVLMIVPPVPTAKQVEKLGQLTPPRNAVVLDVPADQSRPPSAVVSTVPLSPTTTHWLVKEHAADSRSLVVPE